MNDRTQMSGMPDLNTGDRKRLVLIVEDEFVNRELLSAYLENEYEIIFAQTGGEALEAIIDTLPGKDRVYLFPNYIRDSEVKRYFCAADVAVLPYRTATQSGISSIACHFDLPMVVTDVGGLKGTIGARGTGIVASEPSPEAVGVEVRRFFEEPGLRERCLEAIGLEKERLGWDRFCQQLTDFADTL